MNVYLLNTLMAGMDTASSIIKEIPVAGVIGLEKRENSDLISGYQYQEDFCDRHDIPFVEVSSYNLSKPKDRATLESLDIDVLVVCGWQRLLPEWLIDHCRAGVIGFHGSPFGITKGRGRSPQNWALILGLDSFEISIFKIDRNIDSGHVIDTRMFRYSQFDDIRTSYYKVSLLTAEMIVDILKNPDFTRMEFQPQDDSEAEYFPKRTPEDGLIDWNRDAAQIRGFIASLTHPYPGAESSIQGNQVKVWSVTPLDLELKDKHSPGEVAKVFHDGCILVKCKDSFVILESFETSNPEFKIREGMKFESSSFNAQLMSIIERHQQSFPELPISQRLIEEVERDTSVTQ